MLISPSLPFPPLSWWSMALQQQNTLIDLGEHYQKRSFRNRYYLAGPQGKQLMSIPLQAGRNQRNAVRAVHIDYTENWQSRHWKTITSLYKRSPFFDYFEYKIHPLFEGKTPLLYEWNQASVNCINALLNLNLHFSNTSEYIENYPDDRDIRSSYHPQEIYQKSITPYYQVFKDRTGFIPDCSVLDMIFCEGNASPALLREV